MAIVNGRNADPEVVAEKLQRIRDPHVRPLNDLADRIADAEGLPHGHVPYADPDLGGVKARMLVLLDNPSTKAEAGTGSGLLSLDNNDRTARNCREAYARHGVDHSDVVHWNVVPFPVAGEKNGGSTPAERQRAAAWTREVVELLPNLEIVLLLGAAARDGWKRAAISRSDIYVVPGNIPHCSMRGLNTGDGRAVFEKAIGTVAGLLGGVRETPRNPATPNREIDVEIRKELQLIRGVDAQVRDRPNRHAEPASDLSEDEDRFPDIWATSVVHRSLHHAAENLDAACALMLNGDWTSPQFALLRAAYESAGSAVWLLDPDDADTRLARLIWQHHESWRYSAKAYGGTPLDDGGEHEERMRWATDAAARLGIDLTTGRPRGFEALIDEIDDMPGHPQSLLTAWQLCSGVSHAKTWALSTVTVEVEHTQVYEHGGLSARTPDRELFVAGLRVARRTVQRAWILFRIRTTARPHEMTLKLERRDQDGNVVQDEPL